MKEFYTINNANSVLVGNKDFAVHINSYGACKQVKVLVFDDEKEYEKWFFSQEPLPTHNTVIEGTFNIYSNDTSDRNVMDIVTTLTGRYGVDSTNKTVVFYKLKDSKNIFNGGA
ncbi:MAG: hypothetical protein IJA32_11000 [Lachnospiraceae bacterium]|nr:hypothetical protein [Lachnospiraceae bacterium]